MTFGTPYASPSWPAGTSEADKAAFRRMAEGGCELNRSTEEFAKALASIGPLTKLVAHPRHGFAVIDAELAA